MLTQSIEDVEFGIEGGSKIQVCFCSLVGGCSQKFLCTSCPGKATFRQSISWGKNSPNRDRFAYKSPVLLMSGFPRSVILHAGKARELLKNNVPTHQSCWRHIGKLSLPWGGGCRKPVSVFVWGYTGERPTREHAWASHSGPEPHSCPARGVPCPMLSSTLCSIWPLCYPPNSPVASGAGTAGSHALPFTHPHLVCLSLPIP